MTWPIIGILAVAGAGAGVQLGHSAIAEINPIYFSQPPTRFHSELVPNRASDSPPPIVMAAAEGSALGTGCVGCLTYPEEYRPVHDASLDRYSTAYVGESEVEPSPTAQESVEAIDPEVVRLREDVERVERYARGSELQPGAEFASADPEPREELQVPVE